MLMPNGFDISKLKLTNGVYSLQFKCKVSYFKLGFTGRRFVSKVKRGVKVKELKKAYFQVVSAKTRSK